MPQNIPYLNFNGSLRPHAIATLNSMGQAKSPLQATEANTNCILQRGSSMPAARQLIYHSQRHYNTGPQTVYYCQKSSPFSASIVITSRPG
jgi:hypothetical protein